MALPKGKISKARKHSRRANWKLTLPGIGKCPQCGQMKLSHPVRSDETVSSRVQELRLL